MICSIFGDQSKRRGTVLWAAALIMLAAATEANSSGFELLGQNPVGFTASYAGGTAVAEDASVVFYNPAAMSALARGRIHIASSVGIVDYSTQYRPDGTSTAPLLIAPGGNNGGDGGDRVAIPNVQMALPLNSDWTLGFSILSPFGNKTKYDDAWIGRFHARESELKTLNVSAAVGYRINDAVSLGGSLGRIRAKATLTAAVNYPGLVASAAALNPALAPLIALTPEGSSSISGDDSAWLAIIGVRLTPAAGTAIGVTYRGKSNQRLEGEAVFSRTANPVIDAVLSNPASPVRGGNGYVDFTLPAAASISLSQSLTDSLEFLADLTWTGWNALQRLDVRYSDGSPVTSITLGYRDTTRVAVGLAYRFSGALKLRAGIAHDPSPIRTEVRNPQLPDSDRFIFSIGGRYSFGAATSVDLGLMRFRSKVAHVRTGADSAQSAAEHGVLSGVFENSSTVLAVQLSTMF